MCFLGDQVAGGSTALAFSVLLGDNIGDATSNTMTDCAAIGDNAMQGTTGTLTAITAVGYNAASSVGAGTALSNVTAIGANTLTDIEDARTDNSGSTVIGAYSGEYNDGTNSGYRCRYCRGSLGGQQGGALIYGWEAQPQRADTRLQCGGVRDLWNQQHDADDRHHGRRGQHLQVEWQPGGRDRQPLDASANIPYTTYPVMVWSRNNSSVLRSARATPLGFHSTCSRYPIELTVTGVHHADTELVASGTLTGDTFGTIRRRLRGRQPDGRRRCRDVRGEHRGLHNPDCFHVGHLDRLAGILAPDSERRGRLRNREPLPAHRAHPMNAGGPQAVAFWHPPNPNTFGFGCSEYHVNIARSGNKRGKPYALHFRGGIAGHCGD